MKFWKKQKASTTENREYFAEALEPRILYSGAPVGEMPDAPVQEVSVSNDDAGVNRFAGAEEFGSQEILHSHNDFEDDPNFQVILTSFENLSEEEIQNITDAAVQRWSQTELTDAQRETLEAIEISVVDIEGLALGTTEGTHIYLDWNAAGSDWFIDETPFDDEEFEFAVSSTVFRDTDGEAQYGMDLLSVMMHEMGHVLGLEDVYASQQNQNLMFGGFTEGERRLPVSNQADGAEAGTIFGSHMDRMVSTNVDDGSAGSLRETINAAVTGDRVILGSGTFVLSQGDIDISGKEITITGAGIDQTFIDAQNLDRIFNITGTTKVTLEDMTLTNGQIDEGDGGAIRIVGPAELEMFRVNFLDNEVRDTVDNNTNARGGAIYAVNQAVITGTDVDFTNNKATRAGGAEAADGAGFYAINETTVNLTGGTFSGNEARDGAGFYVTAGSKVTLSDVLLNNNTADIRGGAFRNATFTSEVTLIDSTVSNNTATEEHGGGFYNNGIVVLDNTDVESNHTLDLSATNRRDGYGGGFYNSGGTVTLQNGSDILGNDAYGHGGGFANNGGTITMKDGTIDGNSTIYFNTTRSGGGFSNQGDGITNLENVIISNNFTGSDSGGTRIRGVGGGFYNLDGSTVNIKGNSAITGNRAEDGGGFYSSSTGGTVNIIGSDTNSIEIENNSARVRGGGFRSTDYTFVNLSYVSITGNVAETERGGAFYVNGATVAGDHVTLTQNETLGTSGSRQGGAGWISSYSAVSFTDSVIKSNSSSNNGGGFYVENSTLNLDRTEITENYSQNSGGGLMVTGSSVLNGTDSSISDNISRDHGGGMYITDDSIVDLVRTQINGNLAGYESDGETRRESGTSGIDGGPTGSDLRGGGFRALGRAQVTLTDSTINDNEAASFGGGFDAENEPVITLFGSTIANNVSNNYGGGMRLASNAQFNATNSTISGNYTGFARAKYDGNVTAEYNNRVGGALWSQSGGNETNLNHVTITNNHSTAGGSGGGGGIYRSAGSVIIENSIIFGNTADADLDASGQDASDVRGNATLVGANIIGVHNSGSLTGDLQGRMTVDPELGALANNGGAALYDGSVVLSHSISGTSAAAGAAIDSRVATDQRGDGRPGTAATTQIPAFDLTGAQLLTDSRVTLTGERVGTADGTSVDFAGGDADNEYVFTADIVAPGELQPGTPTTVRVEYDFTASGDEDPVLFLSDGITTVNVSIQDNSGGAVYANPGSSALMFNNAGPVNGVGKLTADFVLNENGTTINVTLVTSAGTFTNSVTGSRVLSTMNGLSLEYRAGNAGETYQIDNLAISVTPDTLTESGDLGAFEADPVAETLILNEVTIPENALSGNSVDLSAAATTNGAGPVEYTWTITDSNGNPVPGSYSGETTSFTYSNVTGELVEYLDVQVTATDTTTHQTVISEVTQVRIVNPDIDTSDMAFIETIVVDSLGDETDGVTTVGNVTLREAINAANASAAGNVKITFDPAITNAQTLLTQLTYRELNYDAQSAEFTKGATLSGGGTTARIVDIIGDGGTGDSTGRLVLEILSGSDFSNNVAITDDSGGSALANGSLFQSYNSGYDYDITKTNGAVVIQGNGAANTIIDGNGVDRVFDIRPGASVIFEELTIQGGETTLTDGNSEHGGGVKNEGGIGIFHNVDIINNRAAAGTNAGQGGGIFSTSSGRNVGMIFMTGGSISGNEAESHGGGISFNGTNVGEGFLYLDGTSITSNTASSDDANLNDRRGGGIYISDDGNRVTLSDVTVEDNITAGYDRSDGGGIAVNGADNIIEMSGGSIIRNQSGGTVERDSDGGGFWVGGTRNTFTLRDVTIGGDLSGGDATTGIGGTRNNGNFSSDDGGGFYIEGQFNTVNVIDSSIVGNVSTDHGGGFYNASINSTLNLTQTKADALQIRNNYTNSTNGHGGGFWNQGILNIEGSAANPIDIKWNEARSTTNNQDIRGGGFWNSDGVANLTDVRIEENQANRHGAGFWNSGGGIVNIDSSDPDTFKSTISSNSTLDDFDGNGGGFYTTTHLSQVNLTDVIVNQNKTKNDGAGFYQSGNGSTVTLLRTDLTSNTAQDDGGGFYNASDGAVVNLNTVKIANNTSETQHGGGFRNEGIVVGTDVEITNNSTQSTGNTNRVGGGIYNNGAESSVTLARVIIADNDAYGRGGGIYNSDGLISLTDFALRNNTTDQDTSESQGRGGAIWNSDRGTVTLTNGEVSGNSSFGHGGGVFQQTDGSSFTATNVTFSDNLAGWDMSADDYEDNRVGGAIWAINRGLVALDHVTITNNRTTRNGSDSGSGIRVDSSGNVVTIENSIIYGNVRNVDATAVANDTDSHIGNTSLELIGNNIIGTHTGNTLGGNTSGRITDDPNLGELADNGGFSQTHAIDSGSIAADAAAGSISVSDQRGAVRDATADIGAFEVTTIVYVDDNWSGIPDDTAVTDGDHGTDDDQPAVIGVSAFSTIQAALDAVAAGGTIIINGGTYSETIVLADGKTIEITGPDAAGTVTIDSLSAGPTEFVIIEGSSTLELGAGTIDSVISGSGNILKSGSGTLVLNGENTYDGVTSISEGILEMGNTQALGSNTGNTVVTNSGTLDIKGFRGGDPYESIDIEGAGHGGVGAIINTGGSQYAAFNNVTLTGNATIGSSVARWDLTGTLDMNGNTLTKVGGNSLYIKNVTITDPGSIDIQEGTLVLEARTDFDSPGTITVRSNATLLLNKSVGSGGTTIVHDVDLILEDASLVKADTFVDSVVTPEFSGNVTLVSGTATIETDTGSNGSISNLHLSGDISGPGGLRKTGTELLILSGTNTYQGTTTVVNGTLQVNGTHTGGDNFSVTANGILAGTGSITLLDNTKTVTIDDDADLAPGVDGAGTLTILNDVILNGDFAVDVDGSTTDTLVADLTDGNTLGATSTLAITGDGPTEALYTIINNDGTTDQISGNFNGLPEGSTITIDTVAYKIFYSGGDGNDVVLADATTPGTVYVDDAWATLSGGQTIADADLGTNNDQSAIFKINAFATIEEAIAAVGSGGTIIINDGTYAETIILNDGKTIELTGPDADGTVSIDSITAGVTELIIIEGSTTLQLGAGSIQGVISGGGGLTKTGTGTLTLSGDNTYQGQTTVSEGLLVWGHVNALGSSDAGTVIETGAALDMAGVFSGWNTGNLTDETITVNGAGIATDSNNGALYNSGANQTNKGLRNVILGSDASIGGNGGRFDIRGTLTSDGGPYTLTKVGTNYMGVSGQPELAKLIIDGGQYGLTSTNGFNGIIGKAVEINSSGILAVYRDKAFDANIVMNGGTIRHNQGGDTAGRTLTINGTITLNGTNNRFETENGGTGTVATVVNAEIGGSGDLVKLDPGTLILENDNEYIGSTSINGGTLLINGDNSAATGSLTVANGADLGGSGTIGGIVTVITGADLQPGENGTG
ncbi:MAG: autotransporter-associated beta strand repeat-containing protein, partial [Verrucomicrobiales bacterium]|nr:autotransporter-associated beta strand repeat-containing protein [Verrucomicrobiales bacterium]